MRTLLQMKNVALATQKRRESFACETLSCWKWRDIMRNTMDAIDEKIISLLQENARISIKDIAAQVFLSSPAVTARIERLEKNEIINYSVHGNVFVIPRLINKVVFRYSHGNCSIYLPS